MRRLIFWIILIVVLVNFLPALLLGLSQGISEAARETRGQVASATSGWIANQLSRITPSWFRAGMPFEGMSATETAMHSEYEHCLAHHAASRGVTNINVCYNLETRAAREQCFENGVWRATQPDDNQAAALRSSCRTYGGMSQGTASAMARLFDSATRFRCILPLFCNDPVIDKPRYGSCLLDESRRLRINSSHCAQLAGSLEGDDHWRTCLKVGLEQHSAIGGQRAASCLESAQ